MGRLNRPIEIQHRAVTRDSFGGETETWATLAKVWAEKLDQKPGERFSNESNRQVNVSTKRYKILARADVNALMRVIDDNARTWGIVGIIKNDRQYLTLQLEIVP